MTTSISSHPLLDLVRRKAGLARVSRKDVEELQVTGADLVDEHGRRTAALQEALYTIETELSPKFTPGASAVFQTWVGIVGAKMRCAIKMPEDDTPYWHMGGNPLAGFRSTEALPSEVD